MTDLRPEIDVATSAPHDAPDARRAAAVGLIVWLVVVAAGVMWPKVSAIPPRAGIDAAPFYGYWDWTAPAWMLLALVVGVAAVVGLPAWCRRVSVTWLAPSAGLAGVGWAVVVAACGGGLHRLASPIRSKYEYLPFAGTIRPREFLDTFVQRAHTYPTHVKGHPPGITLAFWALDRVGLDGPGWAAALVLAGWGVGVGAVVWAMHDVAGPERARRSAPFVALVPGVVWAATSGDALIAGVTAAAVALCIAATSPGRSARAATALALAGGVVFALALHLSYGVVPMLVVPAAVAIARRRTAPLLRIAVAAIVAAGAVTGVFVAAGFWWFDGLELTHRLYDRGLARLRPYGYFVFAGNLAALAFAVGPATAAGFGRLVAQARRRPELVLLGAVGVAVFAADLSGLSKAEVERIWLPYTLWLSAAGGAVAFRRARLWLGAQVAMALGLQVWLVTTW